MPQTPQPIGLLSPKQRKIAINKIIDYFAAERDKQIGVIAAETILDFFLEEIGPEVFNKGVSEAQKIVQTFFQTINMEIELLQKETKE